MSCPGRNLVPLQPRNLGGRQLRPVHSGGAVAHAQHSDDSAPLVIEILSHSEAAAPAPGRPAESDGTQVVSNAAAEYYRSLQDGTQVRAEPAFVDSYI